MRNRQMQPAREEYRLSHGLLFASSGTNINSKFNNITYLHNFSEYFTAKLKTFNPSSCSDVYMIDLLQAGLP